MAQVTLVGEQIRDGKNLVEQLVQEGFEITVAFWLKTSEDVQWYLYLGSPVVDTAGKRNSYGRIHALIRQKPQPFWIEPFDVKLLGAKDPLTKAVLEVHQRHRGRCPSFFGGNQLGDLSIDGAYLYPAAICNHGK